MLMDNGGMNTLPKVHAGRKQEEALWSITGPCPRPTACNIIFIITLTSQPILDITGTSAVHNAMKLLQGGCAMHGLVRQAALPGCLTPLKMHDLPIMYSITQLEHALHARAPVSHQQGTHQGLVGDGEFRCGRFRDRAINSDMRKAC